MVVMDEVPQSVCHIGYGYHPWVGPDADQRGTKEQTRHTNLDQNLPQAAKLQGKADIDRADYSMMMLASCTDCACEISR